MCGVFGFVAQRDKSIDLARLEDIAAATETRGNHAFGFTWVDPDGEIYYYKQSGRITDHLGLLAMAADASILVGHCRWATHGSIEDNANNHPHEAHGGCYVHNGVISNHKRIAHTHGLTLQSECDSEVIGRLMEKCAGGNLSRLKNASRICLGWPSSRDSKWGRFSCGSGYVVLGIWPDGHDNALYGARSGNPLMTCKTKSGTYLASLPGGLGRHPMNVADGTVFKLSQGQESTCPIWA